MPAEIVKLKPNSRIDSWKKFARSAAEDDCDVVLEFHGDVDPERIARFIEWANGEYKLTLVVTHAELREYVEAAILGGGIGLGVGLLAKALGVGLGPVGILGAAAAGVLIGMLSTSLHIKVWKYRGKTRMRLAAA